MTTFKEHFVRNKFDVLPTTEQELNSGINDQGDVQDISCKLSRGPTVCIIKYKKFTMSGRTKEGLDEERKRKKKVERTQEGERPSKRTPRTFKKKSFHKKGSKMHKKCPKNNRIMRKRFFQAEQKKVGKTL